LLTLVQDQLNKENGINQNKFTNSHTNKDSNKDSNNKESNKDSNKDSNKETTNKVESNRVDNYIQVNTQLHQIKVEVQLRKKRKPELNHTMLLANHSKIKTFMKMMMMILVTIENDFV